MTIMLIFLLQLLFFLFMSILYIYKLLENIKRLNLYIVVLIYFFKTNLKITSVSADDEFQDLCFKFGLELDEVVSLSYQLFYDLHSYIMLCFNIYLIVYEDNRKTNDSKGTRL